MPHGLMILLIFAMVVLLVVLIYFLSVIAKDISDSFYNTNKNNNDENFNKIVYETYCYRTRGSVRIANKRLKTLDDIANMKNSIKFP